MLKRLMLIAGCFIATQVVTTVSKAQRTLSGRRAAPVGTQLADSVKNCGTSCTYKPAETRPTVA